MKGGKERGEKRKEDPDPYLNTVSPASSLSDNSFLALPDAVRPSSRRARSLFTGYPALFSECCL